MDENTVCTKRCGPRNAFERRFSEGVQKLTPSYYLKNVAPNRRLKNESTKEMPEFYELLNEFYF